MNPQMHNGDSRRKERIFEVQWLENAPNLMKDMNLHIQKLSEPSVEKFKEIHT
jgi:hypothetical protein